MDYEKKYKEALERAKELSKTTTGANYEYIFPELRESEDEKIRKQLLNWFKGCHWDSIDDGRLKRNDIIAWLEKQGEQKPAWSEEDEKMMEAALQFAHEYGRHGLWCWLKSLRSQSTWKPQDKSALEEINESVDRVEPKFKPGDWVIRKNGATFNNGSISARVQRIEGHKVWLEHGTYVDESELRKLTD